MKEFIYLIARKQKYTFSNNRPYLYATKGIHNNYKTVSWYRISYAQENDRELLKLMEKEARELVASLSMDEQERYEYVLEPLNGGKEIRVRV